MKGVCAMSATLLTDLTLETDSGQPDALLGRLASLVALHAATVSPAQRIALTEAAYETFLDCMDLGLEEPARELMRQHQCRPIFVERLMA